MGGFFGLSPSTSALMTVDEFLAVQDFPDGKAELVRGELRMTPPPDGAARGRRRQPPVPAHASREGGRARPRLLSPNETASRLQETLDDYCAAGSFSYGLSIRVGEL